MKEDFILDKQNGQQGGLTEANSKTVNIHCLNIIGQIEGHMILPPQDKATKY